MTNIVVDKSTDQNRFVKLNMADEFVEILVGITVQFYFLKFQGHWLLVKSGTIYYHILYSLSTSSSQCHFDLSFGDLYLHVGVGVTSKTIRDSNYGFLFLQ